MRFTRVALSPDPDLAVAALMIARLEYPHLDARPYIEELDAMGRDAAVRVAHARPGGDTPPGVDPEVFARVAALNDYLFKEHLPQRGPRAAHRHPDHARAGLHGGGAARRPQR